MVKIAIATGVTTTTRHPMVTAGYAHTMQASPAVLRARPRRGMRGCRMRSASAGSPLRRWRISPDSCAVLPGEAIIGHDGPAGKYPVLHLNAGLDEHLPLGISAFGPETLKLGGRAFDRVILHTFFTEETTRRCVDTVKRQRSTQGGSRRRTGLVVLRRRERRNQRGRPAQEDGGAATYLQGYGDLMVKTNGWDPLRDAFPWRRVRLDVPGALDDVATPDQLAHVATLIPDEWLAPMATGSPAQCAEAVKGQLDMGCDGVIMHGVGPSQLRSVIEAY